MRPPSDPADSITPLLWNDQDTGEEKSEAVVYGRVADFCLRLLTKKPSTWKQYRAFGEEVPITALVSQIPADVDVGRTQAKDREEPPREPVVSAEMQRIQAIENNFLQIVTPALPPWRSIVIMKSLCNWM